MAKETKRQSFEDLYAKLEAHVEKLEQGGLSLDEAIAVYEEGMTLARDCQARLDEAEQKITKLKESFVPLQQRTNGAALQDAPAEDYEYVADDDGSYDEEDLP
jgi:exodeoxyribonuclease VII small subunit